jgi:hypothetical protein
MTDQVTCIWEREQVCYGMTDQASGMWCCVVRCVDSDISNGHSAFIFRVQHLRWQHCNPSKHQEPLTQCHSVTSHTRGLWIINYSTVRTSKLAFFGYTCWVNISLISFISINIHAYTCPTHKHHKHSWYSARAAGLFNVLKAHTHWQKYRNDLTNTFWT